MIPLADAMFLYALELAAGKVESRNPPRTTSSRQFKQLFKKGCVTIAGKLDQDFHSKTLKSILKQAVLKMPARILCQENQECHGCMAKGSVSAASLTFNSRERRGRSEKSPVFRLGMKAEPSL
jgi:hypothetical protein